MTAAAPGERQLYDLGPYLLIHGMPLPDLPPHAAAHVIRSLWDRAGFIGPNNGGYPVVSLVAPRSLAESVAVLIERVTGKPRPARPVYGGYWVGVSGRACVPWLRYLYGNAAVACEQRREQARRRIESAG